MLNIQSNYDLKDLTTFKIGGKADFFAMVGDVSDLKAAVEFAKEKSLPVFILGGGSNMLVSDNGYRGLVVHLNNRGIEIVGENKNDVEVSIASGEIWDDVVAYAVMGDFWGIENLSRIPGMTGGFAVQNVGAYGQEASETVVSVETYDLASEEIKVFGREECAFGYRKSIFNSEQKGRYVILSTTLRLSKIPKPNLKFADLRNRFAAVDPENVSIQEIREAVCEIRDKKFPFPVEAKNGNAGSFFKNPTLGKAEYSELESKINKNFGSEALKKLRAIKEKFPDSKSLKAAAFLIELCGLKGYEKENVMVNPTQPLIILNKGNAKAKDVLELVREIREAVKEKTGVHLFTEPEFVGFSSEELRSYGFTDFEVQRYSK